MDLWLRSSRRGGIPGEFAWKDAGFLQALQEGNWVLLDEMNLAPQSVLEGLNAILDHRGLSLFPSSDGPLPSTRISAYSLHRIQSTREAAERACLNHLSTVLPRCILSP